MRDIEYNIFASHAYNVAGVNAEWQTIDIRNPHGNNHLTRLPARAAAALLRRRT